jgi:hypothetical protein
MKKLVIIFMVGFMTLSFGAQAQLTINPSGNIGIDAPSPLSRFSLGSAGSADSKVYIMNSNATGTQKAINVQQTLSNGTWTIGTASYILSASSSAKAVGLYSTGAKSTAYSSGRSFGVFAIAGNATSGYNYGVHGLLNGTNNGAAIFGATSGREEAYINGMYAGYFRGKVYVEEMVGIKTTTPSYDLDVNGTIRCVALTQTSDMGIKKEVKDLTKGLTDVSRLKGVTYKLKTAEELGLQTVMASDTGSVTLPLNGLSAEVANREYTGFLVQDVQKIFPELVSEGSDGVLSVNYIGLIPVLVEAIKQQQVQIEELKNLVKK